MEAPAEIKWTGYSLAERDWRWQRVRDNAAKAGFDCVLVPHRGFYTHGRAFHGVVNHNSYFVWKPTALSAEGQIRFTFGGPVIVIDNGCESLFKREHGLVALA